jgi:hypothetical protein
MEYKNYSLIFQQMELVERSDHQARDELYAMRFNFLEGVIDSEQFVI